MNAPAKTTRVRMQRSSAQRGVARKLALQSLYSWQLNPRPWQDVLAEFLATEDGPRADQDYLQRLLNGVCDSAESLYDDLTAWGDRPSIELDPIERAAMMIAVFELRSCPEVPYKVCINEGVNLTKRFGATDGHKFVNAVLDRAARALRPLET
jgi:N utilization substance protein B